MWSNLEAGTTRSHPRHNCYKPTHSAGEQNLSMWPALLPQLCKAGCSSSCDGRPLRRMPQPRMTQGDAFQKDTFYQKSSLDHRTKASTAMASGFQFRADGLAGPNVWVVVAQNLLQDCEPLISLRGKGAIISNRCWPWGQKEGWVCIIYASFPFLLLSFQKVLALWPSQIHV